jgi:hypothetical protein
MTRALGPSRAKTIEWGTSHRICAHQPPSPPRASRLFKAAFALSLTPINHRGACLVSAISAAHLSLHSPLSYLAHVWHLTSHSHSTCDFCPSSFDERFFHFFTEKIPLLALSRSRSARVFTPRDQVFHDRTVESAYASHLLSRHGIMLDLGAHAPRARLRTTDSVLRGCYTYLGGRAQAPPVPAAEHRCLPSQRSSPGVSCSSVGVYPVLAVEPRCLPSHSGTPVAGHCVPINLATAIDLSLVVHTNVKNMDLIA